MSTIYLSGARHIRSLGLKSVAYLKVFIETEPLILIGDAEGAERVIQRLLGDLRYENVEVVSTERKARSNVGGWVESKAPSDRSSQDFLLSRADKVLLIWDQRSPAVVVLCMKALAMGKEVVLLSPSTGEIDVLEGISHWARAILGETNVRSSGGTNAQDEVFGTSTKTPQGQGAPSLADKLNEYIVSGDDRRLIDLVSETAKARGITAIAQISGLSRTSLYRSIRSGGHPEFGTLLGVLRALGLTLHVRERDGAFAQSLLELSREASARK